MTDRKREINVGKMGKNYPIVLFNKQKVIQIHRVKGGINFEANYAAMKALSLKAYVLYMYLVMRATTSPWALLRKDVLAKTSLTASTYAKAVQELIQKEYLTPGIIDTGYGNPKYRDNAYHLWEKPELNPEMGLAEKQEQDE